MTLGSGATLDTSGTTGGTVLLGGDYQGGKNGPTYAAGTLLDATMTTVAAGAQIKADGSAGNGGDVVVWSNVNTSFAGSISARGNGNGAVGGNAEVSGKETLAYSGTADLRGTRRTRQPAARPEADITISTAAGHPTAARTPPTSATSNAECPRRCKPNWRAANVTVTTASGTGAPNGGNITVANAITWSSGYTLTLSANNNIHHQRGDYTDLGQRDAQRDQHHRHQRGNFNGRHPVAECGQHPEHLG